MAIRQYTSHLAVHTQTQMQTESEAFRTHLKGHGTRDTIPSQKEHGTRDTLPPGKDMEPGTRKGPGTRDTLPPPPNRLTDTCENITFLQLLL